MESKRVILVVKVTVRWQKLEEFNEWWAKNSLPNWEAHGAKHIGSFENFLGEPKNTIIRICEFEDYAKYEKFMEWRNSQLYEFGPSDPRRAERIAKITECADHLEESVWFSVY
jgi:hypothetical protein